MFLYDHPLSVSTAMFAQYRTDLKYHLFLPTIISLCLHSSNRNTLMVYSDYTNPWTLQGQWSYFCDRPGPRGSAADGRSVRWLCPPTWGRCSWAGCWATAHWSCRTWAPPSPSTGWPITPGKEMITPGNQRGSLSERLEKMQEATSESRSHLLMRLPITFLFWNTQ